MTAYFVGDVPAEDLVVEPARGGVAIDLSPFTSVETVFRAPDGEPVLSSGFVATIEGETIVVEWPAETVLEDAGVYELTLILEGPDDLREALSPIRIVVELQGTGWYTLDLARDDWQDAPDANDSAGDLTLYDLLEVAKDQVLAFAPDLDEDAFPPSNYRKAQLMQARNIWNVDKGDAGNGEMGLGGFVVTPKPLDWHVRQILRPKTGRPVVG